MRRRRVPGTFSSKVRDLAAIMEEHTDYRARKPSPPRGRRAGAMNPATDRQVIRLSSGARGNAAAVPPPCFAAQSRRYLTVKSAYMWFS